MNVSDVHGRGGREENLEETNTRKAEVTLISTCGEIINSIHQMLG